MTCGVYKWMECDVQMTRMKHFSCGCGGLRWMVTPEFYGSGIIEGFYRGVVGYMDDVV